MQNLVKILSKSNFLSLFLSFFVIFLLYSVAYAVNKENFDLLTIYEEALAHAPELKAAFEQNEANQIKYYQGLSLLLPSINGSIERSRSKYKYRTKYSQSNTEYYYNSKLYSVEATQSIINLNRWREFSLSKLSTEISEIGYVEIKQQFIVDIATIYFDLLFAQENLSFIMAEQKSIEQRLGQAQNEMEVGIASEVEVLEAQARYDMVNAQQIEYENNIQAEKDQLAKILGFYPKGIIKLRAPIQLLTPGYLNIETWVERAIKNSKKIQLSKLNINYKNLEVKKAFSNHYPYLDLVGSYTSSEQEGTPTETEYEEGIAMIKLTVPIFSGGATYSKTSEEKHRLKSMTHSFEDLKREITRDVREQYNKITASISKVKALRQAVASSQKALSSREFGYKLGTSTLTEILDAQSRLFKAQKDLTSARHEYLLSCLRLKNTAGILGKKDLEDVNRLLEHGDSYL